MNFKNFMGALCCAVAIVTPNGYAQSFERIFFESGADMNHYSIETTPNGEYVIAGTLFRGGNQDIQVMMLDALGSLMWTVNLDETADDRALDVVIDPYGDIVVVGYVSPLTDLDVDLYAVKLDASGTLLADLKVDGFQTAAGTNIIYSNATDSYIVGGFMGDPLAVPITSSVARILELDLSLNVIGNNELSTVILEHASINDIVEVPTGYFITGSTAITDSTYYGNEGVLAVFLDFGLNVTSDLSFHSTNNRHIGVSAVYDPELDEIWLMSNNSILHNPQITQIEDVSGTPFVSTEYYLILTNNLGTDPAGFKLDFSQGNYSKLIAAGLFKAGTDKNGNTDSSVPWIVEFDRATGVSINAYSWPVPSPNFNTHGGGVFSTFHSVHPYIFNQELMIPTADNRGVTLVVPIEKNGNYAIDVFTAFERNPDETLCFEQINCDVATPIRTPISVTEYDENVVDSVPNYSVSYFTMNDSVHCEEIYEYYAPEKTDHNQVKTGSSINLGEATVSVSPNPFNSSTFVEIYGADLTSNSLLITNSLGQVIFSINLTGGDYYSNRIDMTDLPNGLYFLTLTNAEGAVAVTKLIKE